MLASSVRVNRPRRWRAAERDQRRTVIEHGTSSQHGRSSDREQRGDPQSDRHNNYGVCDGGRDPSATRL
jgi:hypothetical protein